MTRGKITIGIASGSGFWAIINTVDVRAPSAPLISHGRYGCVDPQVVAVIPLYQAKAFVARLHLGKSPLTTMRQSP
jgi:hypothetical protein